MVVAPGDNATKILVLAPQPTETGCPYDYDELSAFGPRLFQPRRATFGAVRKVRDVIEHRAGFPWEDAVRGITRRPDIVLALLEPNARASLMLRRYHIPPYSRTPIVVLSCWLAEELRAATPSRRAQLRRQYEGADLILCLSANQLDVFASAGFDASTVAAIPYGVAPTLEPVRADEERDIPLLSVGIDRGRDYATLVAAMREVDVPIDIYAQVERIKVLDPPAHVRVHKPIPYLEYRALLRRAKIVVVPTYELAYPTGQSVALQAAMEGACVIVTNAAPMGEYFSSAQTALMPSLRNPADLAGAIRRALRDDELRMRIAQAGHDDVYRRFTSANMWSAAWREMKMRFVTWRRRGSQVH